MGAIKFLTSTCTKFAENQFWGQQGFFLLIRLLTFKFLERNRAYAADGFRHDRGYACLVCNSQRHVALQILPPCRDRGQEVFVLWRRPNP